jgi:beta-glucosidase
MFTKEAQCTLSRIEIEQKANDLLQQMTLKEKVWLLNGNWDIIPNMLRFKNPYNPVPITTNGLKRLGISPLKFSDGPRGVVMGHSTCFPVSMARGASFDRALERKVGDVIGKETRAQGANLFAGVCINLLRHPAWGRAQETYGEDPYHVGEMGKALTESVQGHQVMACLKHYAVNNIENSRFYVNVKADGRTLREVYLSHFKKSVEAGAACVMGAYNNYQGDQACESRLLLTDILRDEWGFEGYTISDFIFGIRDGIKAIKAGMDVEMPIPVQYQQRLLKAVQDGLVDESDIDRAVLRVVKTLLVFENTPDPMHYSKDLVAHQDHIQLAREVAEKSMVLIKNQGKALPFRKDVRKVLVLGRLAAQENTGDHGSSRIFAPYVVTPLDGIRRYLGEDVQIFHCGEDQLAAAKRLAGEVDCVIIIAGYDYKDEGEFVSPGGMGDFLTPVITGYKNMGQPIKAFLLSLMGKIFSKQIVNESGESIGGDRKSLSLRPEQSRMIKEAGGINPKTVICLVCGSMVMLDDWADQAPAVIYSWYAGMEGGNALPRVLFGDVNPSGKLPFTIPADSGHLPYFSSSDQEITYDLFHGYTLLDKNGQPPAYPFGFGLSYTSFQFSDGSVNRVGENLEVSVRVTNTGEWDGEEVVQVYIGMEDSKVARPEKLLKGFEKVFIRSGETIDVKIPVAIQDLRYYNLEEAAWRLEPGVYRVMVGPNAADSALLVTRVTLDHELR